MPLARLRNRALPDGSRLGMPIKGDLLSLKAMFFILTQRG